MEWRVLSLFASETVQHLTQHPGMRRFSTYLGKEEKGGREEGGKEEGKSEGEREEERRKRGRREEGG